MTTMNHLLRRTGLFTLGALAALAAQAQTQVQAAAELAGVEAVNPYGLQALIASSDWVARAVLLLLLLMSALSWTIIVAKALEQFRALRHAAQARAHFWSAPSVASGSAALQSGSAFRFLAESALEAQEQAGAGGLWGQLQPDEVLHFGIQRARDVVQRRLLGGLPFLATVGSVAPFVGLFGTVWGIYNALVKIGLSGQASIDKVAGPVGESLIMTAIGLAVAVPAVLGYNWLARRNKILLDEVRSFGTELQAVLLRSRS